MPRAEPGTTKHLSKQLKLKGLQRLRWYCQVCERQMRDENGFKQHCQSEAHYRAMLVVGEDPKKWINEYSRLFQRDFLELLRTSHGEKPIHVNRFYQEYIADKTHIHLNATKWSSLTDFAKSMGREGVLRVEEKEDGLFIQWIDNSPEAIRRREALRRAEKSNQEEESRMQREIQEQVERAKMAASAASSSSEPAEPAAAELQPKDWSDFKISLKKSADADAAKASKEDAPKPADGNVSKPPTKPANVFAAAAKRKLPSSKPVVQNAPRKISEAERIMQEELARKKRRQG
ncbi:hypothetical protein VTN77DRAFT_5894 [Rasamsonia byssochlamydoides]|uniref:uncharacterized protein n=1 Tax=Rasamsonia byssochlamydoides TaxID=89139 RepID=UPI003743FB98